MSTKEKQSEPVAANADTPAQTLNFALECTANDLIKAAANLSKAKARIGVAEWGKAEALIKRAFRRIETLSGGCNVVLEFLKGAERETLATESRSQTPPETDGRVM